MMSWVGIQLIIANAILFIYSYKLREDKSLGFQSLIIAIGLAIPTTGLIVFQFMLPVVFKTDAVPVTSYLITFLSISTVTALYKYKLFSLSELIDSELVLDELPVAVISITDTGAISYVNKYGIEFLALGDTDLQQKHLSGVLNYASNEYMASFTSACSQVIQGGFVKNLESSLVISDQTYFVSVSASPLVSNNNIEGALFCLRDITPLRKSIAQLQENEHSLAEAQKLSNMGSWEMDMRSRRMKLSDELCRIYDIPTGEEVTYDQLLKITHPDDLNLVRTSMLQQLGGNEVSEFTYRIILNNNSIKYLNARVQNHLDPETNPDKHLGTVQDITRRVEIENALHQKNLELQRVNESLEEFVFVASHDMKEPLRKIITFSDMIVKNEKENLSEKSRNYFERMITSSHRMQTIIEDLLSVSGIFQNNENESGSLDRLISDAVTDLDMRIREKNAQVIYAPVPARFAGSKQFRQVFFNLLNNSLKFSKTDIPPVISISCTEVSPKEAEKYKLAANQDYININFSDNGIGFDNNYAEKIFQMFERLHSTSEYDGTGIGLAVCKKIAEKHKGTITASGTPGIGASFSVIIPKLIK
jgi:signal transduction histidine kinase